MSKIWFCRNCGYEVPSRGRCHACKARLSSSPLPELAAGNEEEEVGYRLQDWSDQSRSRLIVRLIEANILHRFEDDELVVGAEDESRADDLVDEITEEEGEPEEVAELDDPDRPVVDERVLAEVEALLASGRRLREDPTDMQADSDLAHASATVFMADGFGTDAETWAAVGRVTRRLLASLGADEALEDEIRLQAGILVKLLEPLVGSEVPAAPVPRTVPGLPARPAPLDGGDPAVDRARSGRLQVDPSPEAEHAAEVELGEATDMEAIDGGATDPATAGEDDAAHQTAHETADKSDDEAADESVYELPDWLPEQRAQLSLYLDDASIRHEWEGGDLVVPLASEDEVEAFFDRIDGVATDEDDEARYRTLEDLFAATDRFVNDPDSQTKRMEVVRAVANADGPTPLGLDDAQWWSIRARARTLADSIEHGASLEVIFDEARTLRDLLRVLV